MRDALEKLTGVHYDSVLINYYPDGKCGMRYHADPLYGVWDTHTSVVSLGDTRCFIFREAQDHAVRWVYQVSQGDVVVMEVGFRTGIWGGGGVGGWPRGKGGLARGLGVGRPSQLSSSLSFSVSPDPSSPHTIELVTVCLVGST